MVDNDEVIKRNGELVSDASKIGFFPLAVEKAEGARVIDAEGKEYIDLLGSAAVANVGHGNQKVVDSIKKQADELIHYTPAYVYSEPVTKLAGELAELTPGDFPKKVRLGLSGSDSNDGAIKFARGYTERKKVVSFINSYHGSTYGALTLSGLSLNMRRKLGPFVPEIYHTPYPDCYRCPFGQKYPRCDLFCLDYFENTLLETIIPPEEVAGVIIEPIQGDAGIVIPPDEFHAELKRICEEHGMLFVDEEVQMGFGRSGKWFAIEHWDIEPDMIILGKAIASGMPLSALVARQEIMESLDAPADLFTSEGNPVSCEASLSTINEIKKKDLVEKSKKDGKYLKEQLSDLKDKHELIGDVRGVGLSVGVDLVKDPESKERAAEEALKVCWRCYEQGLILVTLHESVLRLQPPLVISREEVDEALRIIDKSITEVEKGKVPDEVLDNIEGW